jgi:hypothetical protein
LLAALRTMTVMMVTLPLMMMAALAMMMVAATEAEA